MAGLLTPSESFEGRCFRSAGHGGVRGEWEDGWAHSGWSGPGASPELEWEALVSVRSCAI